METVNIKILMMKKIVLIISVIAIICSCNKNEDKYKTINGRWWYNDGNYKEMHANDTSVYVFDFKEIEQSFKYNYVIINDSFWTIPPQNEYSTIRTYFWGKMIIFNNDSFELIKDSKKIIFHRIDTIEDVYIKKLPIVFNNGKLDSIAWERWLNYQDQYSQRAKKFYKDHPEYRYKGE